MERCNSTILTYDADKINKVSLLFHPHFDFVLSVGALYVSLLLLHVFFTASQSVSYSSVFRTLIRESAIITAVSIVKSDAYYASLLEIMKHFSSVINKTHKPANSIKFYNESAMVCRA